MILPDKGLDWPFSYDAVTLIAIQEGCKLTAYLCPTGHWTIGWGHTAGVTRGMTATQEEADQMLCDDLHSFSARVDRLCTVTPTHNQLAAMTSLAFNIGLDAFAKSSILRAHNKGNTDAASSAFRLYNKGRVNGRLVVLNGLVARRAKEAALYLTPDNVEDEFNAPMPQAVEPEASLASSPTVQSGVATIATAGVTTAASVSGQIAEVANNFHVEPLWVMSGVLALVGGVVVWRRFKQRSEGLA